MQGASSSLASFADGIDRATFVAMHRRVWLEEYPEKRRGKAGADARWMQGTSSSLASFTGSIARTLGRSKREVNRTIPFCTVLLDYQTTPRVGSELRASEPFCRR
jgi:hypothetical protein